MSKEIVDPTTIANDFWKNTNLDSTDFAIPRVNIGQGTTKAANGLPGHFNYNTGARVSEMLECKMIVPTKTRVLFNGDGPARCRSDNSFQPSESIQSPISNECTYCPAAQWGTDDPNKIKVADEVKTKLDQRNKPLCTETHNILMADKDWNPFFIGFQKTQIKIISEKLYSRLKGMGVPPYDVAFDMKLQQISSGGNTYYSILFDNFREIDDERGAQIYGMYSKRAGDVLAKQHEEMDQEKVVTSTEETPF